MIPIANESKREYAILTIITGEKITNAAYATRRMNIQANVP